MWGPCVVASKHGRHKAYQFAWSTSHALEMFRMAEWKHCFSWARQEKRHINMALVMGFSVLLLYFFWGWVGRWYFDNSNVQTLTNHTRILLAYTAILEASTSLNISSHLAYYQKSQHSTISHFTFVTRSWGLYPQLTKSSQTTYITLGMLAGFHQW